MSRLLIASRWLWLLLGLVACSEQVPGRIVWPTKPIDGAGPPLVASAVSAGGRHTCAVTTTGAAYCWGLNGIGQLGVGFMDPPPANFRSRPARVAGVHSFVAVSAGGWHSCALTASDEAFCWGFNDFLELGDGSQTSRPQPSAVHASPGFSDVALLATGGIHTCGLTRAGLVFCWGDNRFGQLGGSSAQSVPGRVARTFTALTAGNTFTCGISERRTYCWGRNANGELGTASSDRCDVYYFGYFTESCSRVPLPVADDATLVGLAAGFNGICGIAAEGVAYCWGAGVRSPRRIGGAPPLTSVATGEGKGCGLTAAGDLYCWEFSDRVTSIAQPIGGGIRFASITGYSSHFCGVAKSVPTAVYCWGDNSYGQLGDGTTTSRAAPAKVLSPTEP